VELGPLRHLNIGSYARQVGKFEKPEQKDAGPDVDHMGQVLHSETLNGRCSGESRQSTTPGGHCDVAGYGLQYWWLSRPKI
jgi:hypothetical protein